MSAVAWVLGHCWLYCRRPAVPVTWVGTVWSSGHQVPLHACRDCLAELDDAVWAEVTRLDATPLHR